MHAPKNLAPIVVLLIGFAACAAPTPNSQASTRKNAPAADDEDAKAAARAADPKPIAALVEATRKPEPIGKLLATLDEDIRAWNNLFLTAQSDEDKSKARTLEKAIMTVAHNRRAEIQVQLESGPLNNRIVAAAALGFTRDAEAQSALIAALDDSHPEVVASALLGLWLLGRTDTPLDGIARQLKEGSTEEIRTNAALCLGALVKAGARSDSVLPAAHTGLLDKAPAVRAHSALIMAELVDSPSLQSIADRLYDETPLVVAAAARALSYIGREDDKTRGRAARALVAAWMKSPKAGKDALYRPMVELAGANYGTDEKEWALWAARLP